MTCYSCGATTSNGLALCERCQIGCSVALEFIPVYFRNLSRWRPGRAGSRAVPGSREPQAVETRNDPIGRTLDEAGAKVIGWVRLLSDDRGVEVPKADDEATSVVVACNVLTRHLTSIGTLEWAGDFADEIRFIEGQLRTFTERYVPGWYAGACQRCGTPTHVVPGLTWVTCGSCGATTYARDHIETIIEEANDWIAAPRALAEAAVALLDTEQSVTRLYERIKKWAQREKLEVVRRLDADGDAVGPKRYRFGQVLGLLFSEGATRLEPGKAAKSERCA